MNGRYYGGGMIPTPAQRRLNPDGTISTMVMYGKGKLKTLTVFPSIFKGAHIRHNEMVEMLTGHHIHVEFDLPTPPRLTAKPLPTSPPMRSLAMAAALPDNDDTIYLFQNRHHQFASFFLSVWQGNFHCKGFIAPCSTFFYRKGVRLTA